MTTFNEIVSAMDKLVAEVETHLATVEKSNDLSLIAKNFFALKEGYDAIDAQRKRLYAIKDRLDKHVLPQMIIDSGFDKVQVADIARSFYPLEKHSASIIDKENGFKWLRENGASELITETVNASTLTSYIRDMVINENKQPPEDLFKFTTYHITGVSKYTPKQSVATK